MQKSQHKTVTRPTQTIEFRRAWIQLNGQRLLQSRQGAALVLGVAVFLACLLGIFSRSEHFLAAVWPANGIMLGLLLRIHAAASPLGWLCGALAYLAADLLTGASLFMAVLLNIANLASVATGYVIYRSLPGSIRKLQDPKAMLYLVLVCAAAAISAGLLGALAYLLLYSGNPLRGGTLWYITEFVNYITVLPVLLSVPSLRQILRNRRRLLPLPWPQFLPVLTLVISCGATSLIGGPGAIAFPILALIWCALSYPIFLTALLTLLSGLWSMLVINHADVAGTGTGTLNEMWLVSQRMGIALLTLAPITLSAVMQSRNHLLTKLRHLATHDNLTGLNNRGAFMDLATQKLAHTDVSVGVLMLDIDHFKQINDRHGHAAGDQVLSVVAKRIRNKLRADDTVARIGGEEFAAIINDLDHQALLNTAERLCQAVAQRSIRLSDGTELRVTVSVGGSLAEKGRTRTAQALLAEADDAMYQAKHAGRNRVVLANTVPLSPSRQSESSNN